MELRNLVLTKFEDKRSRNTNTNVTAIVQSKEIDGLVYGFPQFLGQTLGEGVIYFNNGLFLPKTAHDFVGIDYFMTAAGRNKLINRDLAPGVFREELIIPEKGAVVKQLEIDAFIYILGNKKKEYDEEYAFLVQMKKYAQMGKILE
jgi:hypothetical protein